MVTPLPDHVQRLAELGLSNSEARVYLALLGRDAATASEAAQLTGLPRQRLYNLLRGLQEKGFCVELPGPVLKYRACKPAQALTGLLVDRNREFQAGLERQQLLAETLADQLKPLARANGQSNDFPADLIQVLRNPNQIMREYARLLLEARYEFLSMAKLPYVQPQAPQAYERVAPEVRVRFLLEASLLSEEPRMVEALFRFYPQGEHRLSPALPLKLHLFDERKVMMILPHDKGWGVVALVLDNPQVAAAQKLLFEGLWEQAAPAEGWQAVEAATREAVV